MKTKSKLISKDLGHMVSDPDIKFGGSYFADFTENSKDINFNKSNSNISKPSKSSSDSHEIKIIDPI